MIHKINVIGNLPEKYKFYQPNLLHHFFCQLGNYDTFANITSDISNLTTGNTMSVTFDIIGKPLQKYRIDFVIDDVKIADYAKIQEKFHCFTINNTVITLHKLILKQIIRIEKLTDLISNQEISYTNLSDFITDIIEPETFSRNIFNYLISKNQISITSPT